MKDKAFTALVHGVVQGVGFRYHTRKTAVKLGICGTVKNLPSGEVAVLAQGTGDALDQFSAWLQRGPAPARVSRVDMEWTQPQVNLNTFRVIE